MKRFYFLFVVFLFSFSIKSHTQTNDNPVAYMQAIDDAYVEMNKTDMAYMSAAGHGRRAKKVEKLRMKALQTIEESRNKLIGLPLYKSDNSYRKSCIDYTQFCYNVFNDDYRKIVDLEEIAEQSVDEMEAYLLLQEKTNQKMTEASQKINQAEKDFAKKYEVNLVEGQKDDLHEKLDIAHTLYHYSNQIFIVYFKCSWESNEIIKALNNKKITQAEQARNALIKYANEGLLALNSDSLNAFQNDPSLAQQCRLALTFFKRSAENEIPKQIDYYIKSEEFEKVKQAMDAKGSRTKQDVDNYNKAVKEINDKVHEFNEINQTLNSQRDQVSNDWEDAEKKFVDAHMPYYKK